MLTLGHLALKAGDLQRLQDAAPHAGLVYTPSFDHAANLAARHAINALVFGDDAVRERALARLAVLKTAHPEISTLAYLDARPDLLHDVHALGRAQCTTFMIRNAEDHRDQLRERLAAAAIGAAADAFQSASGPGPAVLTAFNLERVLRVIDQIRRAGAFAKALGIALRALRHELRDADLFPPMVSMAWVRLFGGTRRLGDTPESIDTVAYAMGYASGSVFRNACHRLAGATPHEIREHGGLWYAADRYRVALGAWRAARSP